MVRPVPAAKPSRHHDGKPGRVLVTGPIRPCVLFSGLRRRSRGTLTFGPVEGHTSTLLSAAVRPDWGLRHPDKPGAPEFGIAYIARRTSDPDGTGEFILPEVARDVSVCLCASSFKSSALTFGPAEGRTCRFVAIDSDSPADRSAQQIPRQLVPPRHK